MGQSSADSEGGGPHVEVRYAPCTYSGVRPGGPRLVGWLYPCRQAQDERQIGGASAISREIVARLKGAVADSDFRSITFVGIKTYATARAGNSLNLSVGFSFDDCQTPFSHRWGSDLNVDAACNNW